MYKKHIKEQVIEKAITLFCSKGYNNLGVDEICKETGMTKGAFYNSFKSKEEFLLETIESFNQSNSERIHQELYTDKNKKAIILLKEFYFNMLKHQPNVKFMGCYINNVMSEMGALSENIGTQAADGFEHILNAIEPIIKRAQIEGDLNSEISSKEIATLIHLTFYGILTRSKSLGSNDNGFTTLDILFDYLTIKI